MALSKFLLLSAIFALMLGFFAEGEVVEHTFKVSNIIVRRLCKYKSITVVNGKFPGPTINTHEGDTVVVHVINQSPYNISMHWHGIFQRLTPWADGPSYITQCPIRPGNSYTYKFDVSGHKGTLWWHAHASVLRATVYGALIIRPRLPRLGAHQYPFAEPYKEATIMLGEWWNANVVDLQELTHAIGGNFNVSDALTINGRPGDLYRCSKKHTYRLEVEQGQTYLLRIINAALNTQLFFKIAGHCFTVVGADASYTTPFPTDVIVIAPGQTVDALLLADAAPGSYYMAARAFATAPASLSPFINTTTVATLTYKYSSPSTPPQMPSLPAFVDNPTAHKFFSNLTALHHPETQSDVPLHIDERLFIIAGLNFHPCGADQPLCRGRAFSASMNNVSFTFPTTVSLLEAHFRGIRGVYTKDFPDKPKLAFDFTNPSSNAVESLQFTRKGTKVKRLRYNSTVEIVLQGTALLTAENHPLHLHGYNFFVVAQGFGNYDEKEAVKKYNLVNPQIRNTIGVPLGGWVVLRFRADNPGIWLMHCHLDAHLAMGLAMAFEVDDGPTPSSRVPPPPPDFPRC